MLGNILLLVAVMVFFSIIQYIVDVKVLKIEVAKGEPFKRLIHSVILIFSGGTYAFCLLILFT